MAKYVMNRIPLGLGSYIFQLLTSEGKKDLQTLANHEKLLKVVLQGNNLSLPYLVRSKVACMCYISTS